MAGFDAIKRTLEVYSEEEQAFVVLHKDSIPFKVPYEKCYCDEDLENFTYDQCIYLLNSYPDLGENKEVVRFTVDTLGSYFNLTKTYRFKVCLVE